MYVDAVVLGYEGSLLDATSIAARAALLDTRLPRVQVMNGDKAEEMDIEVDDYPTHRYAACQHLCRALRTLVNFSGTHPPLPSHPLFLPSSPVPQCPPGCLSGPHHRHRVSDRTVLCGRLHSRGGGVQHR